MASAKHLRPWWVLRLLFVRSLFSCLFLSDAWAPVTSVSPSGGIPACKDWKDLYHLFDRFKREGIATRAVAQESSCAATGDLDTLMTTILSAWPHEDPQVEATIRFLTTKLKFRRLYGQDIDHCTCRFGNGTVLSPSEERPVAGKSNRYDYTDIDAYAEISVPKNAYAIRPPRSDGAPTWGGLGANIRCPNDCSNRGTCNPELGRCDCSDGFGGRDCSVSVPPCYAGYDVNGMTTGRCIDNTKLFPIERCHMSCSHRGRCTQQAFNIPNCDCDACYLGYGCEINNTATCCVHNCRGRGVCKGGICQCQTGTWGVDCSWPDLPPIQPAGMLGQGIGQGERQAAGSSQGSSSPSMPPAPGLPPGLAADASSGSTGNPLADGGKPKPFPLIYVYDLPLNFTVMVRPPRYVGDFNGNPALYTAIDLFIARLLASEHRTADPVAADLFFIPFFMSHSSWGQDLPKLERCVEYVRRTWPFWDASGGKDHLLFTVYDVGPCDAPPLLHNASFITHWGGATGLFDSNSRRCFRPQQDIVVPPPLHFTFDSVDDMPAPGRVPGVVMTREPGSISVADHAPGDRPAPTSSSDTWGGRGADTSRLSPDSFFRHRRRVLFFAGTICWDSAPDHRDFEGPCKASQWPQYSFGVRKQLYDMSHFQRVVGLNVTARLLEPSGAVAMMRSSLFCLAPSGTGFGVRQYSAIMNGCIPVIVQDVSRLEDRPVLSAFEGLVFWDSMSVRVRVRDVQLLPEILAAVPDDQLASMQEEMTHVWTRMVWKEAVKLPPGVDRLPGPDVFDSIMEMLALRLNKRRQRASYAARQNSMFERQAKKHRKP